MGGHEYYTVVGLLCVLVATAIAKYPVNFLDELDNMEPSVKMDVVVRDKYDNLEIFCHRAEEKRLFNIWKSVNIRLIVSSPDYQVFHGDDEENVIKQFQDSTAFFGQLFPWRSGRVDMPVFNSSCIGVHSDKSFSVVIEVNYIDFWKVTRLACGVILFFAAPHLSRNVFFFYSSGVSLGIIASLLIAVFVLSRLMPKRLGAVSILVGGWALVFYCFQLLYSNMRAVILQYQSYVVAYLVVVGLISFAVTYKYGQVKDERTRNLIQWALQVIGLALVFLSTEWREIAMVMVIGILLVYNIPNKWKGGARSYWQRRFPPKIKLLSEEEYHQQSATETKKALEELQKYCQSPKCQSWKLIRRMNSPIRFAEFVEGGSHLTDNEMLNYELESSGDGDDDELISDISSEDGEANGAATFL